MAFRLVSDVQVRKESWGLLFYSQVQHRLFFIKSRDWLYPHHFNGTWTLERLLEEVAGNTGIAPAQIEHLLRRLTDNLFKNGMVTK